MKRRDRTADAPAPSATGGATGGAPVGAGLPPSGASAYAGSSAGSSAGNASARAGLAGGAPTRTGLLAGSRLGRYAAQLSRDKANTLLLLLGAVMVLAPHASHLPTWTSLTCAGMLVWRTIITLRGTRMPPTTLLVVVAAAAMAAIYAEFHSLLGRDTGVAMLVLLLNFKMLEMHARRDLFVVIFLCFFLVLSNFLYSQSIATGAMMLATVVVLLTAQLSFQYAASMPPLGARLRLGAGVLLMAGPLAVLLFVVFPRITGPLWGMPGDASAGRTGLSDSMAPGNLSSLAQSSEVAFRVKFLDPAPAQIELYWRAMVLGHFDGRTWTRVPSGAYGRNEDAPVTVELRGRPLRQEITLEAHSGRWLVGLDLPERPPAGTGLGVGLSPELELFTNTPLAERLRYRIRSYLDYRAQAEDNPAALRPWLRLPRGYNPRTLALAASLRAIADPAGRARQVLDMFRSQNFVYTLEPPLLGRDSVDDFLFSTRAGFCEYYASAFTVLMRAAGVPARVVTGYQGGEFNPVDGYLTVRQSDAHAWAEIWLAGRGWVRVDPTAAVAPERVQHSLRAALPPPAPFGIAALGSLVDLTVGEHSWLAQLRFRWGAVNNAWNQYVLNYTPERQQSFLQLLGEALGSLRSLAGLLGVAALVWLGLSLRRRRLSDPVDALYSALCAQLARRGLERERDEGPRHLAARLATLALPPGQMAALQRFLLLYSDYKYGPGPADVHLIRTLKSLLADSR